jgi:ABC-type polysaccharide/polyol phosphate transport system ATPase subunit
VIEARQVGVRFLFDRQRRVMTSTAARLRRMGSETWGLRDLSFSIGPGEAVALLGPSGSGKTSLLRLIAGIYEPDAGSIEVRGGVASLLSIDAGLLPLLTGRENALHLGVLSGLSRARSRAALDDVKQRSGLGDYFERPVSSFSQGMRARLGFAVADETDPRVMILDEVHEALDHEYRDILEERGRRLISTGGVVLAAGHDHPMLARLCDRALYLSHGSLRADGAFSDVQSRYLHELHSRQAARHRGDADHGARAGRTES